MPKVLVIGGAGYIGSHVVKELLEGGYDTLVFDDLSTGQEVNLFKEAGFVRGNILDRKALDAVMSQNVDAVVHLAGKKAVGESMENPQKYAENNINGSINILNSMVDNGVKHIVFSSSAAVYGTPQYLPLDEKHPLNPVNFYGFSKMEVENLMEWYSRLKDFNYIALRYFNAVGYAADKSITGREKNPQNLLPIIMEAILGKRPKLQIFGHDYDTKDGTCIRDYIHVTDLASAHVKALEFLHQGGDSQILNLGTEKGFSVLEMVQATQKVTGRNVPYEFAARRPGDPAIILASVKKARQILNWEPTHSQLENIISSTWNAYQKSSL